VRQTYRFKWFQMHKAIRFRLFSQFTEAHQQTLHLFLFLGLGFLVVFILGQVQQQVRRVQQQVREQGLLLVLVV
jgi:hypothetical protein